MTTGARRDGAPAVVLTFHPHPAVTLGGRTDLKLLSMPDERADLLAHYGVDVVITHPFDHQVADTTAYDFMSLLKQRTGLKHIVLGYDAALGKGREGNAARLTEIGRELGFGVEVVPALSDESGVISSTEIRKLIAVGNVTEAARLLGHPYSLRGPVVHGDGRGRRINVPTANILYPSEKLIPAPGIYACWAHLEGKRHQAAVNVGYNPTFTPDKQTPNVEAHIIDLERELYGQDIKLDFVRRLRDEIRFGSVEALIAQIWKDIADVRELLNGMA